MLYFWALFRCHPERLRFRKQKFRKFWKQALNPLAVLSFQNISMVCFVDLAVLWFSSCQSQFSPFYRYPIMHTSIFFLPFFCYNLTSFLVRVEEETISFPVRARGADFWGEKLTFNYFLNGRWFLSCVIFEMSFKSFHGFSFAPEQMSSNGSVWLFSFFFFHPHLFLFDMAHSPNISAH